MQKYRRLRYIDFFPEKKLTKKWKYRSSAAKNWTITRRKRISKGMGIRRQAN